MFKKKNIKFILPSLLIFYIFIFSDIGIISKIKLDKKLKTYEIQMTQFQKDNEDLKIQIERLNKDYSYIAEQARKLGYAGPGEKIYRFFTNGQKTNIEDQINTKIILPKTTFKIKDYLIYIVTFLIVVLIYTVILMTAK